MQMGNPPAMPQGRLIAGCPVRLKGRVRTGVQAAPSAKPAKAGAVCNVVAVTSVSLPANASSICWPRRSASARAVVGSASSSTAPVIRLRRTSRP
ncbi:hypothetical protein NM680_08985 [Paracoccus sp. PS-1]|nr:MULTISPECIES: hypothetical protein [unclassified Paracoccus (in: a-proteobacteria)]MDQ7261929.1 hypothetical protein [Paracoccus sp. PS1]